MKKNKHLLSLTLLLWFITGQLSASLSLPAIFGDNMLVQAETPVPIWGRGNPGQEVLVKIGKEERRTKIDTDGKWKLEMPPLPTGQKCEIIIRSSGQEMVFHNVLAGDVWLCSGQSNMEWPVKHSANPQEEIAKAQYPEIRLFSVKRKASDVPLDDLQGTWQVCSPETIADFSAVGYYFGRSLYSELNHPIGLIDSTWGGTRAEAWTERSHLEGIDILSPILQRYEQAKSRTEAGGIEFKKLNQIWQRNQNDWPSYGNYQDPGNFAVFQGWAEPDFPVQDWEVMRIPTTWESKGLPMDGVVWFRKQVVIPKSWVGKPLKLSLGAIDDIDTTYLNGHKVGSTGKETPEFWKTPRVYEIPKEIVVDDVLTIAIRVFDHGGGGGILGPAHSMKLILEQQDSISIAGDWLYRVKYEFPPANQFRTANGQPTSPQGPNHPNGASNLYNAMIAPLTAFPISGAIWYQGEANAPRAYQYQTLLKQLVKSWRTAWEQPALPFSVVQLANFLSRKKEPSDSDWAELREAQAMIRDLPNTGLATAIDLGEADDIHPKNKQEVGRRLADLALAKHYKKNKLYSGPVFQQMEKKGSKIILTFSHLGGGLVFKNTPEKSFSIAGEDRVFHWANARIEKDKVIVWHSSVTDPKAVRYGWANNPKITLYNKEGLPAFPFRTDKWEGITIHNR